MSEERLSPQPELHTDYLEVARIINIDPNSDGARIGFGAIEETVKKSGGNDQGLITTNRKRVLEIARTLKGSGEVKQFVQDPTTQAFVLLDSSVELTPEHIAQIKLEVLMCYMDFMVSKAIIKPETSSN